MNTSDLIENLARGLKPVTPLWRPGTRAALWSLSAIAYVGILVVGMSAGKVDSAGVGAGLWAPQIAAIVVGLLASRAAFASVVPGLPTHAHLWAVLAALVWLGTLVAGSPWNFDWSTVLGANHEWACVGFIVIGGAPLMLVLTVMLRRGAPLKPAATAALAALGVGAMANVGACLSLPHTNNAITVVWHGGVVLALAAVAALTARLIFRWTAARSRSVVEGARG